MAQGIRCRGDIGADEILYRHILVICTAAGGCMDENAVIPLSGASLLHREAGERCRSRQCQHVLTGPLVQCNSLRPGFVQLPGGFWGDIFILPMFAYCICVSEKGRKRTFNSNKAQ